MLHLNIHNNENGVFDELYGFDDFDLDLLNFLSPMKPTTDANRDTDGPPEGVNCEQIRSVGGQRRKRKMGAHDGEISNVCFSNGQKNTKKVRVQTFRKGLTVRAAFLAIGPEPNMSRRKPSNVLVAFPHFDKCDSLIYFTTSLVRHLNTSDFTAATKLVMAHAHNSCKFVFNCGGTHALSAQTYLPMLELSDEFEPDRIMCVHSTKVVENSIRSTVFMKVTDSQTLYSLLAHTPAYKSSMIASMGVAARTDRFQRYAEDGIHDEDMRRKILALAHDTDDILMYLRVDIVLTIDDATRKIVEINSSYQITSLCTVT